MINTITFTNLVQIFAVGVVVGAAGIMALWYATASKPKSKPKG